MISKNQSLNPVIYGLLLFVAVILFSAIIISLAPSLPPAERLFKSCLAQTGAKSAAEINACRESAEALTSKTSK